MSTYSYGPLKSSYFSQFEKMWIEGYCKERKIDLTESNICTVLSQICKIESPVKDKTSSLIKEAEKFSCYSRDLFIKSWNNILGYTMNAVQPSGTISENQVNGMKTVNKFFLLEAPKIMADEMQGSYFKSFVIEGISNNANVLADIKNFNPVSKNSLIENAKQFFTYDKIQMPFPPCRINTTDIKKNEAALYMIPEADKLIAMIAWSAETTKLLSTFKK
jgi:hypothetical protein